MGDEGHSKLLGAEAIRAMTDLRDMPLASLTICPCGYRVLHDHIPLGTVYTVDIGSVRKGFTYKCGRCGKVQNDVEVIDAAQLTQFGFKPLPFALFSPRSIQ